MILSMPFRKCVEQSRPFTVVSYVRDFDDPANSSRTSRLLYDYLKQEHKNSFIYTYYFTALHYLQG